MCGFAGFIDYSFSSDQLMLHRMNARLKHRGPDTSDEYFSQNHYYQIGLGHHRLAILDISQQGKQPYCFQDWLLVFNGEIYNFRAIRHELSTLGYKFESDTDTEVLIKAFDCWGTRALPQLRGMFAFVLYNQRTHTLYMARDRAGTKPLYIYQQGKVLLFASELKAFHEYPTFQKKINVSALACFFQYGYILAPDTIFENTFKINAGEIRTFDLFTKTQRVSEYWNPEQFAIVSPDNLGEEELLTQIESTLQTACQYRMVSDVPVGIFLSGGYDSSLVGQLLATKHTDIQAFSIGFEEKLFDESVYASKIAQHIGIRHRVCVCTEKEAQAILPTLPYIYDEPFGDSSAIPCILLSRFAGASIKVALSADGGDEVFGGYNKYLYSQKIHQVCAYFPQKIRQIVAQWLLLFPYSSHKIDKLLAILQSDNRHTSIMKLISQNQTERQVRQWVQGHFFLSQNIFETHPQNAIDGFNNMLLLDYKSYLTDNIMVKVDRATMSVGLEAREPLLDHQLVELLTKIPSNIKVQHHTSKYLLKKITHQYLPIELMNRPKKGFSIPLSQWLRGSFKAMVEDYINQDTLNKHQLLNTTQILRHKQAFMKGQITNPNNLWNTLQFQLWYEMWMK
jgi:asparagine synthase (glutamine-hydrolysing)